MMHTTPVEYRPQLRKRADILRWLSGHEGHGAAFDFNVKYPGGTYDDFAKLRAAFEADQGTLTDLELTRASLAHDLMTENDWDTLIENEWDDMGRAVVDGDDEGLVTIWNESKPVATLGLRGRSGGHLIIDSFDGCRVRNMEDVEAMDYHTLYRLYKYVVQLTWDTRDEALKQELLHQVAFRFFESWVERKVSSVEVLA